MLSVVSMLVSGCTQSTATLDSITPREEKKEPVVIQIECQQFPFDLDGNFPYVVLIDNVVHQYDKEIVKEFLSKAPTMYKGEGRTREVTNKQDTQ